MTEDTSRSGRTAAAKGGTTVPRRRFLKGALAGGTAASAALAAPAIVTAQETRTFRMATSWPKNAPGVGVNAQRIADSIEELSDGRLRIQLFAAGEVVPPFEVFDAVSTGAVEMGHTTPYFAAGKDQAFHFFTGVPFGLTAQEHGAWLRFGGGQELWDRTYEPFGVVPFFTGSSGPQAGGWFRREINSLDDLAGLRFRIAGLGGEAMRRLGVTPVLIPPGDIFAAMEAGTVDAAEWVGPWNDLAFGLYRVARYYYMPAFHEPGPALEALVGREAYDSLPADLQAIIRVACQASAFETTSDFVYHNTTTFRPLIEEHDVELREMPTEVVQALARESANVLTDIADASTMAAEVLTSFEDFRRKAADYAEYSELGVLRMRNMGLAG